jgi:hypothetical protein
MWKAWILIALIPLSGSCLANPPTPAVPIHSDQAEIRTARATYNKALASRDVEAISRYWLLDSQSVWANGRLTVGHDNIVARYAKTFKDGDFLFGLRTPQRIDGRCAPQAKRSLGAAATLPCGRRWTATGAYGRISTSRLDVQAVAPVVDPLAQVTVPDRPNAGSLKYNCGMLGREHFVDLFRRRFYHLTFIVWHF